MLATGNVFLEMDLNSSKSTLCYGKNGSGKSTFLDAISFALYGKPYRKISKPIFVNSINKKELVAEVEFRVNNKEYLVRRGMKPTIFQIFEDGVLLSQDAASRDYQELLETSILKMSYKSFCQIIALGSATYVPFMQLPAASRREIIEDLLDIQIFSVMGILLKDKITVNKDALKDSKYTIDILKEKIELHKNYIRKSRQDTHKLISAKKQLISEQETIISEYNTEILELKNSILPDFINGQPQDYYDTVASIVPMEDMQKNIKRKLDEVIQQIGFYDDHSDCPTCKQALHVAFIEETLISLNTKKNTLTKQKDQLEKKLNKLELKKEDYLEKNNLTIKLNSAIIALERKIENVVAYIQTIQIDIDTLSDATDESVNVLEELEEHQNSLKSVEEIRKSLLEEKSTLDATSLILKDGGIKTRIIKQYIPLINKLVNKYLSQMEFDVGFHLDENFKETIKSRYRDEFSYESFSEGEKTRIDVALLFTWREISKLRSNNNTNILILDEIGDSSLDVEGSEDFIRLLQELSGDTNIFMISHRAEGIRDKFDTVIEVTKEKNFTKLTHEKE